MVRVLRLTRLGLSLAAGGAVSGLLHGRVVPGQPGTDSSWAATPATNFPRERAARQRRNELKRSSPRRAAWRASPPPPPLPSSLPRPTISSTTLRFANLRELKQRRPPTWTLLLDYSVSASSHDGSLLFGRNIVRDFSEQIDASHKEFVELHDDWNARREATGRGDTLVETFDAHLHDEVQTYHMLDTFCKVALETQDMSACSTPSMHISFESSLLADPALHTHDIEVETVTSEQGTNAQHGDDTAHAESRDSTHASPDEVSICSSVHFSTHDDGFDDDLFEKPEEDPDFVRINNEVNDNIIVVRDYTTDDNTILRLDPTDNSLRRVPTREANIYCDTPSPDSSFAANPDGLANGSLDETDPNQPPSQPQRSQDSGTLEHTTVIYSQNTQGLWRRARDENGEVLHNQPRDTTKLEQLIDKMRQDQLGAWLVQETWEEGDEYDIEVGGYHIFRHNCAPGESGRDHLFKGVAVILSPEFYKAWQNAGSPAPITTDSNSEFAGRFISIQLKFQSFDNNGKLLRNKSFKCALTSVYHPCHDDAHEKFNDVLGSLLKKIPSNSDIIMGGDVNARIGVRDRAGNELVLGPHGIPRRNARGANLLGIYASNHLRVENTFWQARNYVTYVSKGEDRTPSMHDVFACSHSLHKRVRNCKAVDDGTESDHSAVALRIALTSIKYKGCSVSRGVINWTKILNDDRYREIYNQHLLNMTTDDMSYEDFHDHVIKAGELTAMVIQRNCEGWFQFSRDTLAPLIETRNQKLHALRQLSNANEAITTPLKDELRQMNRHVSDAVSLAKSRWYAHLCEKIHDMSMNPKLAWEYIRILTGGESTHHRLTTTMAMKMENGKMSVTDKEHMSVFYPHFQRVFNNHRDVDLSALERVKQRQIIWALNDPISWEEFDRAVNKLKNGKAAGLNGVPPEAYKAMNSDVRQKVFQHVRKFWSGEADYEGWHSSQCVPVPKRGDLSDPNKWRGVMLMDVCSKIFSTIMNERAFVILDKYGTKFQFGGTPKVGCRDGLFTLKTLLNMRKNHNLGSYVGFVDLVKAYDTANHDLLLKILAKYGAPPKFISAVERMYKDLIVVLKIGKSVEEIIQEVGVRQGDNMAPVLFLFLMTAFAETLEVVWRENDINVVTVQSMSETDFESGKGAIKSHTPAQYMSPSLTAQEIFQCLYVDDGAFIFGSRDDLARGLNLVYEHFARFGLEMHIGRGDSASKTECVFFPPPLFFDHTDSLLEAAEHEPAELEEHAATDAGALTATEQQREKRANARTERENVMYDELEETRPIAVADGHVTFTRHFKYLGSYVSYNLRDDFDVEARITAASQSMGALKKVWDNPHLDTYSKYLLFRAIPMNLLLWGCETWSLREVLLKKLEVFLHRNIRRILAISMTRVQEERIRNEHVRDMFYDIPRVRNMIAARQMDFIGKVIRGPWASPPKRMLTACCNNKRLACRPNHHNKDSLVKNLKLLFARVNEVVIDDKGTIKDWINEASNAQYWNQLVRCLLDSEAELPERPAEWPRRRRSPRNHEQSRTEQPFPPSPPRPQRDEDAPPSPPRRRRVPPRRRRAAQPEADRDYIPENVGRSLFDSLKVLGLGLGATEREVKTNYRALSRMYHPDKHDPDKTGMTHEEANEFFKLINNANQYLREVM